MKKIMMLTTVVLVMMTMVIGCSSKAQTVETAETTNTSGTTEDKLNIIATIFPYYDFVREIGGDKVNLTMLVPAGMETHSFEPTPKDIIAIQSTDLFIYNGGEMERWVDDILEATESEMVSQRMMDYVTTYQEEVVEGMEAEEEEETDASEDGETEEVEYDEHIWTSPVNAEKIVAAICEELISLDSKNAEYYQANADAYIEKLKQLDTSFRDVVENAERTNFIFGDRFPMRYFAEEYGLTYSAAFVGCSTETEPSAATLAFLIEKVQEESIPVVYYIELSNHSIADTIAESTGTKTLLLHSCHNVTKEEFESGVTYLQLMEQNVENLKVGLN